MKKLLYCFSLSFIAAVSCKKKEAPVVINPTTVNYDNYGALKTGNYWIYKEYLVRTDTTNPTGAYDSCYIAKDTLMNNNTYYKYCHAADGKVYLVEYLRDSLSYIVNSEGLIQFSSEDFTNTFRTYRYGPNAATPDTMVVTEKMLHKNIVIEVDAGTFETAVFERTYHYPKGAKYTEASEYRWYAKGMGIVKMTKGFYVSEPTTRYESRLVRYKLQ